MNSDTTEQAWSPPQSAAQATHKPSKRLTGKQRQFVQAIVKNPSQPAYKAVQEAGYNAKDMNVASSIAVENLQKPAILAELAKYDETAQNTVIEVMNYSKELGKSGTTAGASYASTAVQSANSLLDRIHGKSTQRTEVTSKAVVLNINLSDVTDTNT